jgi:hypothetical protein
MRVSEISRWAKLCSSKRRQLDCLLKRIARLLLIKEFINTIPLDNLL